MSDIIPFFHDLPHAALPSAIRLWDAAQSAGYNGQTAYQDFAEDLRFLHIEAPPRSIVKRWIAGVQANLIPRPGDEKLQSEAQSRRRATEQEKLAAALPDFQKSSVKPKAERVVCDVDVMVADPKTGKPARPSTILEIDPETRRIGLETVMPSDQVAQVTEMDFQQFAENLVEATFAEIQRDARQRATRLAANRLREMADRLEARTSG